MSRCRKGKHHIWEYTRISRGVHKPQSEYIGQGTAPCGCRVGVRDAFVSLKTAQVGFMITQSQTAVHRDVFRAELPASQTCACFRISAALMKVMVL